MFYSPLDDVEILSLVSHTFYSPLDDAEILSLVSHTVLLTT